MTSVEPRPEGKGRFPGGGGRGPWKGSHKAAAGFVRDTRVPLLGPPHLLGESQRSRQRSPLRFSAAAREDASLPLRAQGSATCDPEYVTTFLRTSLSIPGVGGASAGCSEWLQKDGHPVLPPDNIVPGGKTRPHSSVRTKHTLELNTKGRGEPCR